MKIQNVIIDDDVIPHVDGVSIKEISDKELRNIQLRLASRLRTCMIDRHKMRNVVWALTMYLGELNDQDRFTLDL